MLGKSLLLIFLIPTILLQFSSAEQVRSFGSVSFLKDIDFCLQSPEQDNTKLSAEDDSLSPSNQIFKFTVKAFQEMGIEFAKKAKTICDNLLNSTELSTSNSPKVLEFKRNLTLFEEQYSACVGIDDLLELITWYSTMTSVYEDESNEESWQDDDAKFILDLLRKYGAEALEDETTNNFSGIASEMYKKVGELEENLSKENSEISKNLLEWYTTYKASTDFDDNISAINDFMELYDDELDLIKDKN